MIVNIDADLVAFRCAASVGDDAACEYATARCDTLMREIVHATQADSYRGFLTGSNNFRKVVNPNYKANRKNQPLPRWLQECRQFLVQEWNCQISDGQEADDLLGIAADEDVITASLDKDMLVIPGVHYNWVKAEFTTVTKLGGLQNFYQQMLIGDKADNIFGVDGIGKVKAARQINPLETEEAMIDCVFSLYNEDAQRFVMNAQCLWIIQKEGETWAHRVDRSILPDLLRQEVDKMLDSMTSLMAVTLTEPATTQTLTSGIPINGEWTESMEVESVILT